MTQEDKDLLIQDLCGRLPYYTKADDRDEFFTIRAYHPSGGFIDNFGITHCTDNIKPYLFPLSSMTEEQKIECFKGTDIELDEDNEIWSTFPISNTDIVLTNLNNWLKVINWLNKNHFDYRGLIEKELAINATGLNIY